MSEHEGGDGGKTGAFLLGFLVGVLVCLGASFTFFVAQQRQRITATRAATMEAERARAEAEEARRRAEEALEVRKKLEALRQKHQDGAFFGGDPQGEAKKAEGKRKE